ncbi:MAG: DUF2306 domain-containing protein [Bacteroidia bacterium]|nr:DUF2306 domain-containing protein [Bacteroidia bacterium]
MFPYFAFTEEALGWWWDYKWSLIGHISGGLLALVLGPLQFWKQIRQQYPTAHRWLGRTYILAILVGALSATYLAWTSGLRDSWAWAFSLQMLALAWIMTTAMAYLYIRRRQISQHRAWMIRSYVVTFAFVVFRGLSEWETLREAIPFLDRGANRVWVSWVVPLLIAELLLRRRRSHQTALSQNSTELLGK